MVERVGSKAREIAVGAWGMAKEAHEQTTSSLSQAWQRVHASITSSSAAKRTTSRR